MPPKMRHRQNRKAATRAFWLAVEKDAERILYRHADDSFNVVAVFLKILHQDTIRCRIYSHLCYCDLGVLHQVFPSTKGLTGACRNCRKYEWQKPEKIDKRSLPMYQLVSSSEPSLKKVEIDWSTVDSHGYMLSSRNLNGKPSELLVSVGMYDVTRIQAIGCLIGPLDSWLYLATMKTKKLKDRQRQELRHYVCSLDY